MTKLKLNYFYTHLAGSLIVVISIILTCQFIWFPSPFLTLDGTWKALFLLASCDIIIGPLLTLLLVSPKKSLRERAFDMTIILIIQISALTYGLLQISQERIYAIIYLNGAFNPVPIKEIAIEKRSTILSLPKYNGIYYGTSLNQGKSDSIIPILFSPDSYQPITSKIIGKSEFSYNKLPQDIKKAYGDDYIFKVLPGKQGVAIVIMDKMLSIKNIVLLSSAVQ